MNTCQRARGRSATHCGRAVLFAFPQARTLASDIDAFNEGEARVEPSAYDQAGNQEAQQSQHNKRAEHEKQTSTFARSASKACATQLGF